MDLEEVHRAYGAKQVDLQAIVKVRIREVAFPSDGEDRFPIPFMETTVGRALLYHVSYQRAAFFLVNQSMKKKAISKLINSCYRRVGFEGNRHFADQIMYTGFNYATVSGSSIGVNDFVIPDEKASIIEVSDDEVERN